MSRFRARCGLERWPRSACTPRPPPCSSTVHWAPTGGPTTGSSGSSRPRSGHSWASPPCFPSPRCVVWTRGTPLPLRLSCSRARPVFGTPWSGSTPTQSSRSATQFRSSRGVSPWVGRALEPSGPGSGSSLPVLRWDSRSASSVTPYARWSFASRWLHSCGHGPFGSHGGLPRPAACSRPPHCRSISRTGRSTRIWSTGSHWPRRFCHSSSAWPTTGSAASSGASSAESTGGLRSTSIAAFSAAPMRTEIDKT